MYRKTYAVIDGKKLENNAREIIKKYPDYSYYIGVVKNNAYQHGIRVIQNLIAGGVNYLAVSSLEEALKIRKYNSEISILVLEPIELEFIDDVVNNKITITVENLVYVKQLVNLAIPYPLNVHMKIDSGMNRLGFKAKKEVTEAYKLLKGNAKITLEGIYSHFATTGVQDVYYDQQINTFKELTSEIDLTSIPIVHMDRSLSFVRHKKLDFVNGVRLGIALFGFNGSLSNSKGIKGKVQEWKRKNFQKKHHLSETILENDLNLQTAFALYSTVFSLRKVKKGEIVGYNASYKVKEDGYIATLPIGFADGVTKEFGSVVINNNRYSIVADSMDMIMVLVDDKVKIGDAVEIFGDAISVKEVTRKIGVNSYHLFNQISNRVPRVHKDNEGEVEIQY